MTIFLQLIKQKVGTTVQIQWNCYLNFDTTLQQVYSCNLLFMNKITFQIY